MRPTLGQYVYLRGNPCIIYAIHKFGTMDVEDVYTGNCYRMTGLSFI